MWRFSFGVPSYAVRSQTILPDLRSRQISFHCCTLRSSDAVPSPYSPRLNEAPTRLLTAVVMNTLSCQTIGLECASPGMGCFQRMFVPCAGFQITGRFCSSATPDADGPRNEGQFTVAAVNASRKNSASMYGV